MSNKPNNPQLWEQAKSQAKQKFDVYPSAYANLWASKWYKEHGGSWSVNKSATIQKDLRQYLTQKWVDISKPKTKTKRKVSIPKNGAPTLLASKWGGSWSVNKSSTIQKDLRQWLKEKWVDISKPIRDEQGNVTGYEKCGSGDKGGYPKCLPEKKASKLNDNQRDTLVQRKRKVGMPQNGAPTMTSSKLNKYFS
jgi:uncharacterized protein YbdZ (MbtH family)